MLVCVVYVGVCGACWCVWYMFVCVVHDGVCVVDDGVCGACWCVVCGMTCWCVV